MTYNTEQEQNDHNETPDAAGNSAPENATGCCNAGVLRFLGDRARSVEPDEDPGRGEVRQAPVPPCGGSGPVVCCHEGIVGGSKPVGAVACRDREPNHVQDEINEHECCRQVEYPFEVSG